MEEIIIASNAHKYDNGGYTQIDVRSMPDPNTSWEESDGDKPQDGRDPRVEDWLKRKYVNWDEFLRDACNLVNRERKVVFLCQNGQYRSVAVANAVGRMLKAPVLHIQLADKTNRSEYVLGEDGKIYVLGEDGKITKKEKNPVVVLGSSAGGSLWRRREEAKAAKGASEGGTGGGGSMFIF